MIKSAALHSWSNPLLNSLSIRSYILDASKSGQEFHSLSSSLPPPKWPPSFFPFHSISSTRNPRHYQSFSSIQATLNGKKTWDQGRIVNLNPILLSPSCSSRSYHPIAMLIHIMSKNIPRYWTTWRSGPDKRGLCYHPSRGWLVGMRADRCSHQK